PAGEYSLKLRDPARRYIRLDNPRLAPKASVGSNSSVGNVDATLKYAPKAVGRIAGEVQGAGSERQATTYVDAYLIDTDHYYNVATSMVKGGKYSFGRLPDGEYVVRASSYQFASGEFQRAYYHDGQSDGEASLVNLQVAEELSSINVYLDATSHAQLAGQVLDHEGEPLRAITVTLLGMDMLEWQTVTTDDEGRFHMQGIAPDRYRLQFKDPKGRYESTYLDSKDFFTSSAMELTDGETGAVTARLSSTGKVQGTIELTQKEPGRVVFFVDVYKEQGDGKFARVATRYLREPGDFTVSGVPSGEVRVAVRAYNRTTRASTVSYHLGGKSVEESPGVPVSPEQGADDIQFYVSI
ncbi:MAG: carboxypeptidase-like regulatory domain-containing protein, partial [Pseudomonadota bacterium]